jgi:dephospho-CoA kinase
MKRQQIVGVTGVIGSGKTHLCKALVNAGKRKGIPVHHIEIDEIRRAILDHAGSYKGLTTKIQEIFGEGIIRHGTIDRTELNRQVFREALRLAEFNKALKPHIKRVIRDRCRKIEGIVLIEWPLAVEEGYAAEQVILVDCNKKDQEERLLGQDLSDEEVRRRIQSIGSPKSKKDQIIKRWYERQVKNLIILDNRSRLAFNGNRILALLTGETKLR